LKFIVQPKKFKTMNDNQRNKINMYGTVIEFLDASVTFTSPLIVFAALFLSFKDYVTQIYAVSEEQERDNTGVTVSKKTLKKQLINKMFSIATKCYGYASGIGDSVFMQQVKIPISMLTHLADNDLVKKAEDMITTITPYLSNLTGYGVTANDMEALLGLKDDFKAIYGKPISGKESTAQLTARLNLLYKNADSVLKRIDDQIATLFDIHPDFHETYIRKRAIVKLAKRIRAFQMWVMDDETSEAIAKAKVTITLNAKAGTDLTKTVKRTGSKGGVLMNNMAGGEYRYEVSFGGYVTEQGTFFVNDGLMTEVNVKMKLVAVPV
jgi:hypothetical protein